MNYNDKNTVNDVAAIRILSNYKDRYLSKCSSWSRSANEEDKTELQRVSELKLEKEINQSIEDRTKNILEAKEEYLTTVLTDVDECILETATKRKKCPVECTTYLKRKHDNQLKAIKKLKHELPPSEVESFQSIPVDSIVLEKFDHAAEELLSVKKMASTLPDDADAINRLPVSIKIKDNVACKFDNCFLQYNPFESRTTHSKPNMILQKTVDFSFYHRNN